MLPQKIESDMYKKEKKVIIVVTQLWLMSHSSHLSARYVHWFSSSLDFTGVTCQLNLRATPHFSFKINYSVHICFSYILFNIFIACLYISGKPDFYCGDCNANIDRFLNSGTIVSVLFAFP